MLAALLCGASAAPPPADQPDAHTLMDRVAQSLTHADSQTGGFWHTTPQPYGGDGLICRLQIYDFGSAITGIRGYSRALNDPLHITDFYVITHRPSANEYREGEPIDPRSFIGQPIDEKALEAMRQAKANERRRNAQACAAYTDFAHLIEGDGASVTREIYLLTSISDAIRAGQPSARIICQDERAMPERRSCDGVEILRAFEPKQMTAVNPVETRRQPHSEIHVDDLRFNSPVLTEKPFQGPGISCSNDFHIKVTSEQVFGKYDYAHGDVSEIDIDLLSVC